MLLQAASKQQTEAFRRLLLPELKPLLGLLESELTKSQSQLAKAEEPPRIYRLQGRVQFIEDFLQSVQKASGH